MKGEKSPPNKGRLYGLFGHKKLGAKNNISKVLEVQSSKLGFQLSTKILLRELTGLTTKPIGSMGRTVYLPHEWLICMVNVCINIPYMGPLGNEVRLAQRSFC